MALLLTAPQCFFIAMLAFGLVGFIRGWRREIVSMAFALAGVLFLYLGGGNSLAQLVFVRFPVILQFLLGNSSASSSPPPAPDAGRVFITTLVALIVIVGAGYFIGNKAFPKTTAPADRFLGIIPGLVTGLALITYINNLFSKSPLITVGVNTPSQNTIGSYMLIIVVVAVVAVIAGLIAASTKKGGAGGKK